ncbi:MAG: RNA polymerase sigma factor [Planctomycetes bacterium]|nr:RNA polymerase sigma factor [Planctomycetota bacterium]
MKSKWIDEILAHIHTARNWIHKEFKLQTADVEDIVQDVLLAILEAAPPRIEYPKTYFFRACWRRARKLKEERAQGVPTEPLEMAENVLARSPGRWSLEPDDPILNRLTPAEREIAMRVALGYTLEEAAAELGIPASTARRRLHTARRSLNRKSA